ncbi:MAG: histidine kinase N-terminal 7TM domain-containing protein [Halobellus sp.]
MNALQIALVLLFALSGAACFAATRAVSQVPNADVRRGLLALLLLSGLWAASEAARLLVPSAAGKELLYILGLVVGLPTVAAWLYFCSAYTGHDYHRKPVFRQLAVAIYTVIVAVKITNPYHGLYFRSSLVAEPFPHLTIQLMPAHWFVTGLSYVLTAIGFYLLYELFSQSNLETRPLAALVAVTALPVVLDILSYTGHLLLTLNYEPVGVAVFAVGVLYVVDEQFVALPAFWRQDVLEALDDPIVVFDREEAIRDYNTAAADHFPDLGDAAGEPLAAAYPSLAAKLADGDDLVETDVGGVTQYYAVERQSLESGGERFGRVVILSDVTVLERQRRELQRQNDQFDDFAEAITHELRNTLAIARGYLDVMGEEALDDAESSSASPEFYERVTDALERMDRITTDLSKLARDGQTLQGRDVCDVSAVVERGWAAATTDGMSLSIDADGSIYGDEVRLADLFKNAFEFARANGATTVTVSRTDEELRIASDGDALSPAEFERAFSYGEAVPSAETGMLLPNVRTLARAHGWEATGTADGDGLTIRIKTS